MAYKIRIKHDVPNKTLNLHLKYNDSNLNLPTVSIALTDSLKEFNLTGWDNITAFDKTKVQIEETEVVDGDTLYEISANRINITYTAPLDPDEDPNPNPGGGDEDDTNPDGQE